MFLSHLTQSQHYGQIESSNKHFPSRSWKKAHSNICVSSEKGLCWWHCLDLALLSCYWLDPADPFGCEQLRLRYSGVDHIDIIEDTGLNDSHSIDAAEAITISAIFQC
jgi:hypothetical protein